MRPRLAVNPTKHQHVGAPALHATTSSHQPCQHEPFKHLVFLTTCIAFDPQTPLLAVVIPSSHQPFMPAVHSHSLCRPGSSESIHSGLYADHPLHLASTDPYFTLVWTLRSSVAASSRWSSFALATQLDGHLILGAARIVMIVLHSVVVAALDWRPSSPRCSNPISFTPLRTPPTCSGSSGRTSSSLAGLGRIAHPTPFESVSSGALIHSFVWPSSSSCST